MTAGRVLIVAGSDSGGGAGVQADIKTVTVMGAYAASAITAITVQNTLGVTGVHAIPVAMIAAQMQAVLDDIGADVIKIGMLGDAATIETVAGVIESRAVRPRVVLDPVMVAKGGAPLLDPGAVSALMMRLLPLADIVTPNTPELAALTGMATDDAQKALAAGAALIKRGARAVLVKGGHLPGDTVEDWLLTPEGHTRFSGSRIESRHTHGTGCTLASAIAASLAQGMALDDAVLRGRAFVRAAMQAAPGLGAGHGPLGHHLVQPAFAA